MRGCSTIPRIAGVITTIWLYCGGLAWAGDGGEDLGTVQTALNAACQFTFGMTSCPQLPTITQVVLEFSALANLPPDFQRGNLAICAVPGSPPPCQAVAVNAVNPPAPSSEDLPSSLTPLAFISPPSKSPLAISGQAVPVPQGTSGANSFFSAVTTGEKGQPQTLNLAYDYLPWTNRSFATGVVVQLSLPLQVLKSDGSERLVCGPQGCPASVATLQISAKCTDDLEDCLSAVVLGDFSKPGKAETRSAAALGIKFQLEFGPSSNSQRPHAMLVVQAPLLVTGVVPLANPIKCGANINDALNSGTSTADPKDCGNDPAYFGVDGTGDPGTGTPTFVNQKSGLPTAFLANDLGVTPTFLSKPVGIAPYAAPPCVGGLCDPTQPQMSTFGFCASLWADPPPGAKGKLNPAVAAQLAIGTDGTTYVSAARIPQPPLPPGSPPPPPPPTCPF